MFPFNPMGQMPPTQIPFSPFTNQLPNVLGAQRGGGFLAKLLGSGAGAPQAGMNMLGPVGKSAGIGGFLSNTQNVMKTINTVGPMVQQYSPMLRNVPAMLRIFREFNNLEDADPQQVQQVQPEIDPPISNEPIKEDKPVQKKSIPKLYI